MLCRRQGITGFPSYLIKNDDTEIIIGGYQNLNTFHTIIKRLSAGRIKPRRIGPSTANLIDFVKRYDSVYPVEVEILFALDRHQSEMLIKQLIASHKLAAESVGDSYRLILPPHRAPHRAKEQSAKSKELTLH